MPSYLQMVEGAGAPAITFDSANNAVRQGTVYRDTVTNDLYVCANPAPGAAVWRKLYAAGRIVSIADAATYTVLAANSGVPHILPDLGQNITISLPTPAAGLEYEFFYKGVAADASNWVIDTGANVNFFLGGLVHLDTDANSAGDEVVPIAGDGNSNSKLTVVTPGVGTRIKLICDGTNWILSGYVNSATVPSFADQ